ncbi:Fic family protein [Pseudoglutamicibacter cumminsii]|uniref:Fic family protein n=1 Tax=Pseudoglutamicibacter cumminsii TaxID=156979 RepID=UPI0025553045|nr:Fic family protein [Pseudoglutamicibacter cumminsii]MDK7083327.1 Fic family protein [Pseudoglutamicibacter cumminsii]
MSWTAREWTPSDNARRPRDRWHGTYWAYQPFSLTTPEWRIDPAVAAEAGRVERRIRNLKFHDAAGKLEAVSRHLLRSEAVSSSYMEGLRSNAKNIVFEELKQLERGTNGSPNAGHPSVAAEVAANIAALTSAVERLGTAENITWADIEALQTELLPHLGASGIRDRQNWVGGSETHPGQAEFIPPSEDALVPAVKDLVEFMSGAAMGSLIQAGLVHAQFETLHPFADGNGRIGRALIHTVLVRGGLTEGSVLPISQVLLTRSDEYIAGLMAFRGIPHGAELASDAEPVRELSISEGINAWLRTFIAAADDAVDLASALRDDLDEFESDARDMVTDYAERTGKRKPREDSTVWKILEVLPKLPTLSIELGAQLTQTSTTSAKNALDYLLKTGVLESLSIGKGKRGFVSKDLIDLLNRTQRKWASSRFDTRISEPNRPVPGRSTQR